MSEPESIRKPLLVTGGHRSGTSWVGKMIASSGEFTYINEPLNKITGKGVFDLDAPFWYMYICEDNQSEFLEPFKDTISLNYQLLSEISTIRSVRDLARTARNQFSFWKGKMEGRAPLIKDPFAVFSTPWFVKTFDLDVVIVVRNPYAYVNSLVKLGWFNVIPDLLSQPLLIRDHISSFHKDLLAEVNRPADPITRAALFWCVLTDRISFIQKEYSDNVRVVRHEDLSLDPEGEYEKLFGSLKIPYTKKVRNKILRSTGAGNPTRLENNKAHSVIMNSRKSLQNWKTSLSSEDIEKIKEIAKSQIGLFYSSEELE